MCSSSDTEIPQTEVSADHLVGDYAPMTTPAEQACPVAAPETRVHSALLILIALAEALRVALQASAHAT